MSVYTCRRCEYSAPSLWEGKCPQCKGLYRAVKKGVDSADQKGLTTLGGSGAVKSKHHYHSTGQEGFDKVLGGGLVAGRVVLFGGFAGVGKTRLLLMTADHIAKTQGKVIYASGEESSDDLVGIASHLEIKNDDVVVMGNQCSIEKVLGIAKKIKAFLVIWDSAQKFASDHCSGSPGSTTQCKAIGEAIKSYAGETKTCSIIVNQMSGSGDLKGGTELEHHCDTIMVLGYPKDDDEDAPEEKGIRGLYGSKNRVGTENLKTYWKMHGETDPRPGFLEYIPAKSKIIDISRGRYSKKRSDDD